MAFYFADEIAGFAFHLVQRLIAAPYLQEAPRRKGTFALRQGYIKHSIKRRIHNESRYFWRTDGSVCSRSTTSAFVQANSLEFTSAAARPTLQFLWLTTAWMLLSSPSSRTRYWPGRYQQPAPLRCGHQHDHPRRRPCGHLLQREGRFSARLCLHLRPC